LIKPLTLADEALAFVPAPHFQLFGLHFACYS
jgi:hypothetical protein